MQIFLCVTWRGSWLSCLFVVGVSGHGSGSLFVCSVSQYCMYDTDDVAPFSRKKVHSHYISQTFFAKGA